MIDHPEDNAVEAIERRLKVRAAKNRAARLQEVEAIVWPAINAGAITREEGAKMILKYMNDAPVDPID